jgi:hypothetical protein
MDAPDAERNADVLAGVQEILMGEQVSRNEQAAIAAAVKASLAEASRDASPSIAPSSFAGPSSSAPISSSVARSSSAGSVTAPLSTRNEHQPSAEVVSSAPESIPSFSMDMPDLSMDMPDLSLNIYIPTPSQPAASPWSSEPASSEPAASASSEAAPSQSAASVSASAPSPTQSSSHREESWTYRQYRDSLGPPPGSPDGAAPASPPSSDMLRRLSMLDRALLLLDVDPDPSDEALPAYMLTPDVQHGESTVDRGPRRPYQSVRPPPTYESLQIKMKKQKKKGGVLRALFGGGAGAGAVTGEAGTNAGASGSRLSMVSGALARPSSIVGSAENVSADADERPRGIRRLFRPSSSIDLRAPAGATSPPSTPRASAHSRQGSAASPGSSVNENESRRSMATTSESTSPEGESALRCVFKDMCADAILIRLEELVHG